MWNASVDVAYALTLALTSLNSRIFENIISGICTEILVNDELQFDFKKGVGLRRVDVIFVLRSVVGHFIRNKSSVFAVVLDESKASDRVHNLLETCLPRHITCNIFNWYLKKTACGTTECKPLSLDRSLLPSIRQGHKAPQHDNITMYM